MNFSISYDVGFLGTVVVALMVGAGLIVLVFLLQGARNARHQVMEHEHAEKNEEDGGRPVD